MCVSVCCLHCCCLPVLPSCGLCFTITIAILRGIAITIAIGLTVPCATITSAASVPIRGPTIVVWNNHGGVGIVFPDTGSLRE